MARNSSARPGGFKNLALIMIVLAIVTGAAFSRSISYGFINYDDDAYVYRNPHVLQGLGINGVKYALTTCDIGTWAPLTWLSYECDASLWGQRPAGYHLTNLLLHIAAGMMLCLALCAMNQSVWVSVTVAALFLLHPLRIESVVWVAERKDVLCAFFWMLGLVAYAHYVHKPNARHWTWVFLCFLAGLMSKMMMITFPFVLLVLDWWPLKRFELREARTKLPRLILEKLPFFVGIIVVLGISASALHSRGAFSARQNEGLTGLLRVPVNYGFYLQKIFWPEGLSILYPIPPIVRSSAVIWTALLVLVSAAAIYQRHARPWFLTGWVWFIGTLVPVVGLVSFSDFVVADRYTYIASIGVLWAILFWVEHATPRFASARWVATIGLATVCLVLTTCNLPRWHDSLALYNAALSVGPNPVTYNNRGVALLESGDVQAAFTDFNSAIGLNPSFAQAHNNRGSILSDQGHYDEAILDFDSAIQQDPGYADAYDNRGNALARKGDPEKALGDYARCIKLDPSNPSYFNNRAAAYFQLKRFTEASADLRTCKQMGGKPHPGLVQALSEAMQPKL